MQNRVQNKEWEALLQIEIGTCLAKLLEPGELMGAARCGLPTA